MAHIKANIKDVKFKVDGKEYSYETIANFKRPDIKVPHEDINIDAEKFRVAFREATLDDMQYTGSFSGLDLAAFSEKAQKHSMTTYYDPEGLSHPQLERLLSKVEYKPGWEFEIKKPWNTLYLIIYVKCKCSRTGEAITQCFNFQFEQHIDTEEVFYELVKKFILDIEKHECLELFEVDGKKIFDPHNTPYDGQLKSGYW